MLPMRWGLLPFLLNVVESGGDRPPVCQRLLKDVIAKLRSGSTPPHRIEFRPLGDMSPKTDYSLFEYSTTNAVANTT